MLFALVVLLRQFCKSEHATATDVLMSVPKGATKKRTSGIGSEVPQPTSGTLPENHITERIVGVVLVTTLLWHHLLR
jgi:hypothetical protein